jgi:hypothetical protein
LRKEKKRISLIKNLLWILLASGLAFVIALILSVRMELSAMIAGAHLVMLLVIPVLYEYIWGRLILIVTAIERVVDIMRENLQDKRIIFRP